MIDNILAAAVPLTTPLLLAALGGLLNRLGGIVNIGLEGMMLAGAFAGVLAADASGSVVAGFAAGTIAGAAAGLVMSLLITRLGADQIVAGLGLDILVAGIVGFTLSRALDVSGSLRPDRVRRLGRFDLGPFESLPVIGPVLGSLDLVSVLAWLSVPLVAWLIARSRWGLHVRAVGADDQAARTLGVRWQRVRDSSTVVAGAAAGLGGAYLPLGVVGLFNEGMVAGRGFIALAAFYFGRNRPWPTAAACALFAVFDAAQVRLQGRGISASLVQVLPYVAVIVVLTLAAVRSTRPHSPTEAP